MDRYGHKWTQKGHIFYVFCSIDSASEQKVDNVHTFLKFKKKINNNLNAVI